MASVKATAPPEPMTMNRELEIFVEELVEVTNNLDNKYELMTTLPLPTPSLDTIGMEDFTTNTTARKEVFDMWVHSDRESSMKKLQHLLSLLGQHKLSNAINRRYYSTFCYIDLKEIVWHFEL